MKKTGIIIGAAAAVLLLVFIFVLPNRGVKLSVPENIVAVYDGSGNMKITWKEVENATLYQIVDNDTEYESNIANFTVKYPQEETTHNIKVRAVANKKSKEYYSEWGSITYDIESYISTEMGSLRYIPSGQYLYIIWDAINGASYYSVKLGDDGQEYKIYDIYTRINNCVDGQNLNIHVTPVRELGDYTYSGKEGIYNVEFPTYDYAKMGAFEYALDLDLERLKKWASVHNYSIDISEKDGETFADVHYIDMENSGLANTLGRFFGSVAGGYLVGLLGSAEDTYNEDLSRFDHMLEAFAKSGGVKEYAQDKKAEFSENAKYSAIEYGIESLFADTDIHYVYRYNDVNDAPLIVEMYMMHLNHDGYRNSHYGDVKPDADNIYHFKSPYSKNGLKSYLDKAYIGDQLYWVAVATRE